MAATKMVRKLDEDVDAEGDWDMVVHQQEDRLLPHIAELFSATPEKSSTSLTI
jgi:hypothetical protein